MRRAALLLVVALAGCLGPPIMDGPPAGQQGLTFGAAQQLPGDRLGAEPNLATGPDGNVWVIAVGSVLASPNQNIAQGAVNLWRSPDFGATWERQRDPGPQDKEGTWCSCDTDVDFAQDGTLYITDFWVGPGNGFVVEASRDLGATWEPGNPVTTTNPAGNDRQYVVAGRDPGEVYLAYNGGGLPLGPLPVGVPLPDVPVPLPGGQTPQGGLTLWRSTDAGRTLAPVATMSGNGYIGRPRVAEDGTIFYPWVEVEPGAEDGWNGTATVMVATSTDRGATFTDHVAGTIANGVGGLWPMEIDVGRDGRLHVVWMERVPGSGSLLWYTFSDDAAATFAEPRVVSWPDGTALLPWIAHAGPGRAIVTWYGNDTPLVPLEAPADARWYTWAKVLGQEAARDGPAVQAAPWPVKVGTFCPRGAACPEDRELLDYPAVIWRDGWAHVAFASSLLDQGAGPPSTTRADEPKGGHSTNALVYAARARLP